MKLKNKTGFTLIEVIVVITLIAVLSAIGIPIYQSWLPNMRLQEAARDLFSNIQKAKVEAMKRNVNSALVFNQTVSGTTYVYIIFADTNANCEFDVGEPIFTYLQEWPKFVSLDPMQGGGDGLTFVSNDDGNPMIAFLPTTIPTGNLGGMASGTAFLKNTKNRTRDVVISSSGRVSIN